MFQDGEQLQRVTTVTAFLFYIFTTNYLQRTATSGSCFSDLLALLFLLHDFRSSWLVIALAIVNGVNGEGLNIIILYFLLFLLGFLGKV